MQRYLPGNGKRGKTPDRATLAEDRFPSEAEEWPSLKRGRRKRVTGITNGQPPAFGTDLQFLCPASGTAFAVIGQALSGARHQEGNSALMDPLSVWFDQVT
jgi:hypothetical protein